jgi:multiple sugar transport system permease protein
MVGTGSSCHGVGAQRVSPWLWFLPVILLLSVVTLYPAAVVVWLSVQKTRFYEPLGFAGLRNYTRLLTSDAFWQFSLNSLLYVVGTLAAVLPSGLGLALLLQALGFARNVVRTILLLPWTLSMAVLGSFWIWLLNPSYGPISYWLQRLGVAPGLMLGDPQLALPLLIVVTAWWTFPYVMVMMSAALQGIPRELYEAVNIDGAGRVAAFRYVTWPFIAPTLGSTALILSILYLTLVTLIIVLTGGGPLGSTTTWSFEIFRAGFQSVDLAPASALSIVVLIVNLGLGVVYTKMSGRAAA